MAEDQVREGSKSLLEALRTARAPWETDGHGVRGPQNNLAQPSEIQVPGETIKRGEKQPFFPEQPAQAGGADGTPFDLYGALNGAPATWPVLLSGAPTPTDADA